jgi:hypothetical protein
VPDDGDSDEAPLPTMMMPRSGAPSPVSEAAPLQPTMMPTTAAPLPAGAPPPMPADWRYEIRSEIARGGMGRVVEATDTVLGRDVALKEALALDPESVRRFQRETRITAKLEHPSIVPVHDAGISPAGAPFYVMRKVSGQPLEELVAKYANLEDRLALLPHIVAAAHALAHAHERGIVHRDIKPSNILVGELGETIVIDWGLAKAMDEADETTQRRAPSHHDPDDSLKTRAGIVFGTPGFMAPEQLRGSAVDERCDVYALGATLYHLLARRPPHYSKDAEKMMRDAVSGPPEPLRSIVPGVPPELATIIDKALAHDSRVRYQDARALAEDLQRFLTGQLVASHHYSRRERLVRFVRKNRSLVGVTTAAVLALVIGGTYAVARIALARDHADESARIALDEKRVAEEQRQKAEDRLQQLKMTTAHNMTELDPTGAVAMLQSLSIPRWWREARAIAAAAQLHGIAHGLPASQHTLSLEMSSDGQRALAAGDDGIVRVFDLAKNEARAIADVKVPAMARFADADHTIVVYRGNQLILVDVQSGARRETATPTPIAKLAVSGPIAYWADPAGALWRLDVAHAEPEHVDNVGEAVHGLEASPDGRWIALAGADHMLLLDRTQPSLPPQELVVGRASDVSWSADSLHLVALVDQDVIAFEMPTGTIVHRQYAGERYSVMYSGDRIFTTAPTGVTSVIKDDPHPRKINGDYTLGLHEARGGTLVTGSPQGVIAVISPDGDETLHTPQLRISRIEASPHSPWLIAATEGRLLVWNLDAIEPRQLADSAVAGAGFASDDEVVVTYADQPAQWIDLRDGSATPLGMIPDGIHALVPAPGGTLALLVDGTRHARIVSRGAATQDLGDDIERAAFLDRDRLVVADSAGEVSVEDLAQHRKVALANHPGGTLALAAHGPWVTAAFEDRVVWRINVDTNQSSVFELPPGPWGGGLAIDGAGNVIYPTGASLHAWHGDGSTTTLATFERPIVALAAIDGGKALAITADSAGHLVDVGSGAPGALLANMSPHASVAPGGLVASTTSDGVLEAIDAPSNMPWVLAQPKGRIFGFAQISPGGRRALATTQTGLLVWTLALPDGPDATEQWLRTLTNAIDRGDGAISWR